MFDVFLFPLIWNQLEPETGRNGTERNRTEPNQSIPEVPPLGEQPIKKHANRTVNWGARIALSAAFTYYSVMV